MHKYFRRHSQKEWIIYHHTTRNYHIEHYLMAIIFLRIAQITYDWIYMKHVLCFVRFSCLLWLIENGKINACDYDDNKSHANWVNKLMRNNLDWDKQPEKIHDETFIWLLINCVFFALWSFQLKHFGFYFGWMFNTWPNGSRNFLGMILTT